MNENRLTFASDYMEGAHPLILKRLAETNLEKSSGYGTDNYSESAREKIRAACGTPEADVFFLAGGTQTNAVMIGALLRPWQGVISARSGHVSVHEAGAIEYTGHEVLEVEQADGKIRPETLSAYLAAYYADGSHEHMTFPGMVYVSHPTEYGTLYTKAELEGIAAVCREYGLRLFLDGARLAYGLMSRNTDLTLQDIARLCDVFYIGGTKAGALCGEAVVFTKGNMPPHFLTSVKKRGALLAKGRLLGVQFDALFTNDLYFRIGKHAIDMAEKMKDIFRARGIPFFIDSPTNQQFVILENEKLDRIAQQVAFEVWEKPDESHTVVRFAAGWSTTEEDLAVLDAALAE